MQGQTGVSPFFARHKKSVLTFLLFIAYAGAVFWSNYLSLQRAQENSLVRFQLEAEKQASAISYFFSERRIEAAELAESEPIVNFFKNRDMGMSYQYGLGVNVQLIEDRFEHVASKKRSSGHPVFLGFMLIDSDGSAVAEWMVSERKINPKEWLSFGSRTPRTTLETNQGTIVIMAPVWIDGVYRGELLAWVAAEASFAQFGTTRTGANSLLVNRETGEPLNKQAESPLSYREFWGTVNTLTANETRSHVAFYMNGDNRYNIARFDIDSMPMAFVQISNEEAADSGTARLFVIATAVVPFIVLLAGFLDVLERRRLENLRIQAQTEAERHVQARSDFLANMSHEIRTPMNAIIGMTELCLASRPNQKQRNYLTKIQQTSDLLLRIINDILDFSKIESGKLDIESTPFDLNRTISDVGNLLSGKAAKKGIEIVFDIDDSCDRIFIGDSMRLEQVLINLIGNAIKFSDRGNIIIRARADDSTQDKARVTIEVIDEGIGISREQQTRLFNAFTQADPTTTRRFGGTGLGLAICKRLVELMGGNIAVQSEAGRGSTFSFFVSLGIDPSQEPRFAAFRKQLSPFAGRHVLVIDHNPVYRHALSTQLAQIGLSCITFASSSEAISTVTSTEKRDYLAILADQHTSDKNGMEVVRELRDAWPNQPMPPVFLLMAYSLDAELDASPSIIDRILTKPTTANQLYLEIAPFLGINVDPDFLPRVRAGVAAGKLRGMDILLVDDVPFNQEVVRDMLKDVGIWVRIANNGAEALTAVAAKRPDCILMDCQMPVMDGYEATRRLRQDTALRKIPIIALTANALASEREKCRLAGMDGYIVKPVKSADLIRTLAKHTLPESDYREVPTKPPQLPLPATENGTESLPELPGIDITTGLRYANGRLVNYRKILTLFADTHGRDFAANVSSAINAQNWDEAARHAHSFKSASRTIGATHLGDLGTELENACRARQVETARTTLDGLATELQIVCAGLTTFLQDN